MFAWMITLTGTTRRGLPVAAEHVKTIIKYLPAHHDIVREVLIVLAGSLAAVAIVRMMPPRFQQFFTMPVQTNNQGGAAQ